MLIGKYVRSFSEATHALPQGMHMNADYPFMLPAIRDKSDKAITIVGRSGQTLTVPIKMTRGGVEFAEIAQSSTFEHVFRRKPTKFRLLPFREEPQP